ncbi:MAG: hypothetical protein H6Q75_1258 [Firmicutes bacterium]|nr:hypothetical protein [Bacillota bacterium]
MSIPVYNREIKRPDACIYIELTIREKEAISNLPEKSIQIAVWLFP